MIQNSIESVSQFVCTSSGIALAGVGVASQSDTSIISDGTLLPLSLFIGGIAFTAALTLILGAAYTLWMYKRVIFGEAIREEVSDLKDIDAREGFILFLLAGVVLLFGVWPAPVFDVMHVSIQQLIEHISQTKLL